MTYSERERELKTAVHYCTAAEKLKTMDEKWRINDIITDQRGAYKANQLTRTAADSHQDTSPAAQHLTICTTKTTETELPQRSNRMLDMLKKPLCKNVHIKLIR